MEEMKKTEEEKIKDRNEKIIKEVNDILSKFPMFHGKIVFSFKSGWIYAREFSERKQL